MAVGNSLPARNEAVWAVAKRADDSNTTAEISADRNAEELVIDLRSCRCDGRHARQRENSRFDV